MPYTVPLEQIPSQQVPITFEGVRYTLLIRQTDETLMLATVWRGLDDGSDLLLVENQRCGCRTPLIPYEYLEGPGGNFWFETMDDELPQYDQFGGRHLLMYATVAELAEARA